MMRIQWNDVPDNGSDFSDLPWAIRSKITAEINVLQKAAELGNANAQYELASLLCSGTLTDSKTGKNLWGIVDLSNNKSYRKSKKWYRKAAEQNHPAATYILAYFYTKEYGLKTNPQIAHALLLKAADLEFEDALHALSIAYTNGNDEFGITPNKQEGKIWMARLLDLQKQKSQRS